MFATPDITKKRKDFINNLKQKKILRFVGSFSPLISKLIQKQGFEGIYISGAIMSSDLGLPDVEMLTRCELQSRGSLLVQQSTLPSLIDADTGFGGNLNVARTTQKLEQAGFCGLHLEDQQSPKRCGHLNNKKLIDIKQMQQKIEISIKAKTDSNFLIVARTDARGVEGLDNAIKRAKAYVEAGAEAIFPEALQTIEEFKKFRAAVDVPLIANITEFGKSELLSAQQLEQIGYNIILYPVTIWRVALKAVENALIQINSEGDQKNLLKQMFTREQLYELLQYDEYIKWDKKVT